MKLIKGKGKKNITMAEIFNGVLGEPRGDHFIDYGKGLETTKKMVYMEDLFSMFTKEDDINVLIKVLKNDLHIETEGRDSVYRLFIDGDFSLNEARMLKSIEIKDRIELIVSVQTDDEGISIQEI